MTIYTCPECGADLFASVIYTNPPINRMDCPSCGWHWESKPELIERVSFNEKSMKQALLIKKIMKLLNGPNCQR